MNNTLIKLFAAAALTMFVTAPSWADNPGKHPYYLTALADLRDARAQLQRMDTDPVDHAEDRAVGMIDLALAEIRRAAINDGKNIHDHVRVDAKQSRADRFHKAIVLLAKAKEDVMREEDMEDTRGLQKRVITHIEDARRDVQHVITTVLARG